VRTAPASAETDVPAEGAFCPAAETAATGTGSTAGGASSVTGAEYSLFGALFKVMPHSVNATHATAPAQSVRTKQRERRREAGAAIKKALFAQKEGQDGRESSKFTLSIF
jgi:hypothetical protein